MSQTVQAPAPDISGTIDIASGKFPTISGRDTRRGSTLAFLAWTLAVYDFILFGTLLPRISDSFGWSDTTALTVNTLVAVGVFVVVILVGLIVDHVGRRRGMMITVGGAAASSVLTALSSGVASLVGFRALSGFGMAEQSVNSVYLNEVFALTEDKVIKKHRGFFYSLVQTGWPVGALLAAAFVAGVTGLFGEDSWRLSFIIATVPALLVLFLRKGIKETPQYQLNLYLKELMKQGRSDEAAEVALRFGVQMPNGSNIRKIFSQQYARNTVLLCFAWIVSYFAVNCASVLGTTMLEDVKDISPGTALLIVTLSNVAGALGYLVHGWLGDRYGRKPVIVVGWSMAAVFWTAFIFGPSTFLFTLVAYMGSLFFLLGPYAPLMFLQAECYDSTCRATGSSFVTAMGQPGTIIGSAVLTALVASSMSMGTAAFIVGSGGMLFSGLIMIAVKSPKILSQ